MSTATHSTFTALIAEDEPLLAAALQAQLAQAWPAPGRKPFPQLVFVTAYDQYAMQAFEAQAVDYLLKPIQAVRLEKTVQKLQLALANKSQRAINSEATLLATLDQLRGLLALQSPPAPPRLSVIQASVGNTLHMVPVASVLYLEAADKYVRVLTAEREYLIRTPLKDLIAQLDPLLFWQIHRATVVQAKAVAAVTRDEQGKLWLHLRGSADTLAVSRVYTHLFKAM